MNKNYRIELEKREGERFSVIGIVDRFGTKNGYKGPIKTLMFRDILDANTGNGRNS